MTHHTLLLASPSPHTLTVGLRGDPGPREPWGAEKEAFLLSSEEVGYKDLQRKDGGL